MKLIQILEIITNNTQDITTKYSKIEYLNEQQLNEVGEASIKPYNWFKSFDSGKDVEYSFKTDSNIDYIVTISWIENNNFSLDFTADGLYLTSTNDGDVFKIMSTIVDIIKSYINHNKNIENIVIRPSKRTSDDKSRKNIYMNYVKKQLPNNNVKIIGDYIIINIS
jgi:hypothetical protein